MVNSGAGSVYTDCLRDGSTDEQILCLIGSPGYYDGSGLGWGSATGWAPQYYGAGFGSGDCNQKGDNNYRF